MWLFNSVVEVVKMKALVRFRESPKVDGKLFNNMRVQIL